MGFNFITCFKVRVIYLLVCVGVTYVEVREQHGPWGGVKLRLLDLVPAPLSAEPSCWPETPSILGTKLLRGDLTVWCGTRHSLVFTVAAALTGESTLSMPSTVS